MLIRPYEDADADGVIALWTEVLPDPAPHNEPRQSLRMKVDHDRELLLVAVEDGAIVGSVMGGFDGHRGWIYSMAVKPEHQRRGIGGELVRELEVSFRRKGCLKVNLQVRTINAGVAAFYERMGFRIEELVSMGKRLY
jgi:ribosomal protein S18 acetylase RimI-like enzyme